MESNTKKILIYTTLLVVLLYFLFWGLVSAKAFLAPLAVAVLLAMLVLPIARWLEGKGMKRGWAAFFSDLLILLFFAGLAAVLSYEVKSFIEDWPKIKQELEPKVAQLQRFIQDKTGIPVEEQNQKVAQQVPGGDSMTSAGQSSGGEAGQQQAQQQNKEQPPQQSQEQQNKQREQVQSDQQNQQGQEQGQEPSAAQQEGQQQQQQQQQQTARQSQQGGGSGLLSSAGSFIIKFFGFLGTALLTLVYIFFFLLYRSKFRKSVVRMVPKDKRNNANEVIGDSVEVSQNYLVGKLILCAIIAVCYAIGLSLSGIKNAILIAVLASLLTLIPYLGNIIGFGLAMAMALFSGGGTTALIGVVLTFGITQFLESYLLEPYVVGDKVHINPVMVIIAVVLGNAVWGVVGMLIAIPVLGIAKVVFDHVAALNPLGYLLGQEDIGDDDEEGTLSKIKQWAKDKTSS